MKQPFRVIELLFEESKNPFDASRHLFKFQRGIQTGFPTLVSAIVSFITLKYVPQKGS